MADLNTLARQLVDAEADATVAENEAKNAKRKAADAEDAFWNALNDAKQKRVDLELGEGYGLVTFQRQETVTGNILAGREKEAFDALTAEGVADEVFDRERPVLRKAVLNQLVRERLKAGQPLPTSVNFHSRKYITITRKDS